MQKIIDEYDLTDEEAEALECFIKQALSGEIYDTDNLSEAQLEKIENTIKENSKNKLYKMYFDNSN